MVACLGVSASNPVLFPSSRLSKFDSIKLGRVTCEFQKISRDPSNKKNGDKSNPFLIKNVKRVPSWMLALSNISTLFVEAEKMWGKLSWNMRQLDTISDQLECGKLKDKGRFFQQKFTIRSYEIGANGKMSLEAILNHCQDCALNHFRHVGLSVDGFGSSPEMNKRDLILILCKLQVAVDCYPSVGDLINVSSWISACGKNAFRQYICTSDLKTGKTILRLNCMLVMMNKHTRKLSKCFPEIKREFEPFLTDCDSFMDIDKKKLLDLDVSTADYVQDGLIPELKDLDINQHVNNSKYIGLILESMPLSILNTHELSAFTLEYRKECKRDNVLQSLTSISNDETASCIGTKDLEFNHMLRLQNGDQVVKGRTSWKPKSSDNSRCIIT